MTRLDSVDRWWSVARPWAVAALCHSFLLVIGCAGNGAASPPGDAFHRGRSLVTTGKYADAIPVLQGYLDATPRGKYASRAGLFLGKAHVALGEFDKAKRAFEDTAKNFPHALEGHKCRYKLAFLSVLTGDIDDAINRFEDLAARPDGPLAPEAKAFARYLRTRPAKAGGPPAEVD